MEEWEQKKEAFKKVKRKIKNDIFDKTEKGDDFSFGNHIINAVERKNEIVGKLLYDWEKKKLYEWDRNQMSIWVAKQYKNPDPPGQRHKLYAHGLTNSDNHERIQLIIHVLLVDAVFDRLARDLCRKAAFEVQFRNWAALAKEMEFQKEEIRSFVCNPLNNNFHGLKFEFDPEMHSTFDENKDDWEPLEEKSRKNFIMEFFQNRPRKDAKSHQALFDKETEDYKWEMLNAQSREKRKKAKECVRGSVLLKMAQDRAFSDETTTEQLAKSMGNIAELKGDVKMTKKLQKQKSRTRRSRRGNEDGDPINRLKRNLSRPRKTVFGPPSRSPPSPQQSSSSSSPSSSLSSPSSSVSSFSASHRSRPPLPHRMKSSPPAIGGGIPFDQSSSTAAGTSTGGPFNVAESVYGIDPVTNKPFKFLRSEREAEENRQQQRQQREALVRHNESIMSGGNGFDYEDDESDVDSDMDSPRHVQQQSYHDGDHRRLDKSESKKRASENYERSMWRKSVNEFSEFYDEFASMSMSDNSFLNQGLNQMVDDAKLMGNINSGEDPHYDQLTESEKKKIALHALLSTQTRRLFAAGPGRVFLRTISVLSKQMTANEIRQFTKYFEWFPFCSVRENPDTIEANGNGEPAAYGTQFDVQQAEMDDDEDFKQFMQEIKNELLKDSGPRHSFDGSVSGRRRSVDGASARRRSIGVASNGRLSVDGAASAMRSSSGNRMMRSKSVSQAPTRSLTTSKLSEETIQQLVERYSPPK
ncbi:hypothetical protein niasHT_024620 [Heterodera trifolii]|uniref:Uncharacterized protein n=1 Tax=Heterodera trifolii TaxID=157864 RepID=A0ABD2K7I2_9BILA